MEVDDYQMSEEEGIPMAAIKRAMNKDRSGLGGVQALQCRMKKSTSIAQLLKIYSYVTPDSEEEQLVLRKWEELACDEVAGISNLEAARVAYEHSFPGSKEEWEALGKWMSYSSREVLSAATFGQAYEALSRCPSRTSVEESAYLKCLDLARTAGEARAVYLKAKSDHWRDEAFTKWLELCSTSAEAHDAWQRSPKENRNAIQAARRRWKELSNQEVASSSTLEELRAALRGAPPGSQIQEKAIRRLTRFYEVSRSE